MTCELVNTSHVSINLSDWRACGVLRHILIIDLPESSYQPKTGLALTREKLKHMKLTHGMCQNMARLSEA